MRKTFVIVLFLVFHITFSQKTKYKIRTIAFYNVENLFDTVNDSLTFDDQRTPNGKYKWTKKRYYQKIENISKVLSQIGKELTGASPDIIGLCEIENKQVLVDLVNHPNLKNKNYGIVHHDSPDERGIDVALLYKQKAFIPNTINNHRLLLFDDDGFRNYTRDQLIVEGVLDGENIYFIVNHWPSRSGGEAKSKPNRINAAKLNKKIIDSVQHLNPEAKLISIGDFNDDPANSSFKKVLKTIGKKKNVKDKELYNPFEKMYKKGLGSLAYRDKWNLFDQIFVTKSLISNIKNGYTFWKAGIYNPSYIINSKGKYKGYPFRTYAGGNYSKGYSDHFPVYMFLIKHID